MNIEVDYRQLQNESDYFLSRVEESETIVITRRGKRVAESIPHRRGDVPRWLTPSDVLEIRKVTSEDPTWATELAEMRAADELGPVP